MRPIRNPAKPPLRQRAPSVRWARPGLAWSCAEPSGRWPARCTRAPTLPALSRPEHQGAPGLAARAAHWAPPRHQVRCRLRGRGQASCAAGSRRKPQRPPWTDGERPVGVQRARVCQRLCGAEGTCVRLTHMWLDRASCVDSYWEGDPAGPGLGWDARGISAPPPHPLAFELGVHSLVLGVSQASREPPFL